MLSGLVEATGITPVLVHDDVFNNGYYAPERSQLRGIPKLFVTETHQEHWIA
jgi:hypothetical protein